MLEYSRNAHREKCWSSVNSIRPWAFGPVVISIRPLAFGPVVNSIPPLAFGSVMNSIRPLAFGPVVPTCSTLPYLSLTFSQSNLTVLKRKSFWKSLISTTHTHTTHNHTRTHTHTRTITHAHEQEKVLQVKKIPFAAAFPRRPFSSRSAVGVDLALNNPAKIQVLKKLISLFKASIFQPISCRSRFGSK